MSDQAHVLPRFVEPVLPRTTFGALAFFWLTASVLVIRGGEYQIVTLALVWAPFLIWRPKAGLWFAPALMMAASLLAPPAAFEWGVGYSPELAYWAVASCIVLLASFIACYRTRAKRSERLDWAIPLPRAFYAFAVISVLGAAIGLWRGYALNNVAKQFYGCLLFLSYFWFAVELAPHVRQMRRILNVVVVSGVLLSLVFVVQHSWRHETVHLTILADYSGSLAVLLLPQLVAKKIKHTKTIIAMAALVAVPMLAEFKRSVAGIAVCALLLLGLRSRVRWKRYAWLCSSYVIFTLLLATPVLDYVGRAVANQPLLANLVPENVETNYSVYLRLVQAQQILSMPGEPSIFGTGLGSTLNWYDPYAHIVWSQEGIDIGWVYLLVKMGVAGLAAFVWLIVGLLGKSLRLMPRGIHLGLVLVVVFFTIDMVASSGFLYFMSAMWAGASCGWVHVLNHRSELSHAQL